MRFSGKTAALKYLRLIDPTIVIKEVKAMGQIKTGMTVDNLIYQLTEYKFTGEIFIKI